MNETIYQAAIRNGCTPRMAEMLACRKAPSLNTDDTWWRGNKHFSEEHGEEYASRTKKFAESYGVKMGPYDDYIPWLARYPGDPAAVVSGHDARAQIKRAQDIQAKEIHERKTKPPAKELAPDLVEQSLYKMEQDNPDLKKAPESEKQKIRREIIEKQTYQIGE